MIRQYLYCEAVKWIALLLILTILHGCNSYEYQLLEASKIAFINQSTIQFKDQNSGQLISLNAGIIDCEATADYTERKTSVHMYNQYHGELCAQRIYQNTGEVNPLDHWIRSQSKFEGYNLTLVFDQDRIPLPPLDYMNWGDDEEEYRETTDSIQGMVFEHVYVAQPLTRIMQSISITTLKAFNDEHFLDFYFHRINDTPSNNPARAGVGAPVLFGFQSFITISTA